MNRLEKQKIFEDMKKGVKPRCLPMDVIGYAEYRKDIYNQGEPDKKVSEGEVVQSTDGLKKYTADGGIWDVGARLKYRNADDIFSMDIEDIIVESVDSIMLDEMKRLLAEKDKTHVVFPWHYGTLLTRCQIKFGWEPLLEASALEPEKLGRILNRIGLSTLQVLDGWSRLEDVYMIIVHDDIASTKGTIWSPEFLRKYVFPWYKRFFDVIHNNGKKVLYISDGNYLNVAEDILALNPDGLYCESTALNPADIMKAGGPDLFYLLKTNSRIMDFGNFDNIKQEVLEIRDLHEKYPRIFSYIGGGTNKPENKEIFMDYYREYLVYE